MFWNLECRRHLSLPNFGIEKLLVAWKFFVFSLGSKFWRELCVSQRSLHNAPIFRLLLKVAVNGTHQCDFQNFCGQQCPTRSTRIWVLQCLSESIFRARSVFACSQEFLGMSLARNLFFSLICGNSAPGKCDYTFSAFWLWSSVVSVLISVTTDMFPTGDLLVTCIFGWGSDLLSLLGDLHMLHWHGTLSGAAYPLG